MIPKTYYMHTINGKPAYFIGEMLRPMHLHGEASPLAKSLKQIQKEQTISWEYRKKEGWHLEMVYGHLRVSIDDNS